MMDTRSNLGDTLVRRSARSVSACAPRCLAALVALSLCSVAWGAEPADLAVAITRASLRVGSVGRYTITVRNTGGTTTDDAIHVVDVLPEGLTFVSARGTVRAGWSCTVVDKSVDCVTSAPLRVGSTVSLRVKVAVAAAALPSVDHTVTAFYAGETDLSDNTKSRPSTVRAASGSTTAPAAAAVVAIATPTVTPIPSATDLLLAKTTTGTFTIGTLGAYRLSAVNLGPSSTNTEMTVIDTLPQGLTFVSASGDGWGCSVLSQIVTCVNPEPLAVGASSGVTIIVSIGEEAYPTVTNTAILAYAVDTDATNNTASRPTTVRLAAANGSDTPKPSPTPSRTRPTAPVLPTATPTATPIAASADLSLVKTIGSPFFVGGSAIYVLTVSNQGPNATDMAVTLVDTLPVGLTFVQATGSGWSCSASGQTVTCINPNPLDVLGSTFVTIAVDVTSGAYPTVTNKATISYPGDTVASNNFANRPTTIRLP